jgi:hypothetical protein
LPEEWLIERIQQVGATPCNPLSPSFSALCFAIAGIFRILRYISVTAACPHCPKTYRALELHRVTGTRRIINMHAKTPEISPLPALDGGEPELW